MRSLDDSVCRWHSSIDTLSSLQVMHDAMRASGAWASLYFVALVVIGTFIVLNLFLAILLGNFEGLEQVTIEEKRRSRMRAKSHQAWVSCSTFATCSWL